MRRIIALACVFLISAANASASSYMDMSLEDLMDVTLTSMSKREQSLQDTAAAATVLTSEDIRRSGATTIPDALRLVPGLMVAQSSTGEWAVASRGRSYNPTFDNKLLVLVDGRSVYSALYGGVFWESLDLIMEDIDRIEVIRGPGTSIWGANAVNGVINIITRSSVDTQGLMASASYGNEETGTGLVRYGGMFGVKNTYRVFAKYRNVEGMEDIDANEIHDGLESGLAGFRMDLTPDEDSTLMLEGDVFSAVVKGKTTYPDLGQATMVQRDNDSDVLNANLLGRYERNLGNGSSSSLQSYYSREYRDSDAWGMTIDTFDVDFQYQFVPLEHHLAQWGLGYRLYDADLRTGDRGIGFTSDSYLDNMFSLFLQDEFTFGDWVLTIGSKFQYTEQTGLQYLPSAHLLWHVSEEHVLWGAVSRAVRTPSIVEQNGFLESNVIPGTPPIKGTMYRNPDAETESSLVYELGYRFSPSSTLYFDASTFLTKTDNMVGAGLDLASGYMDPDPPHIQIDSFMNNDVSGTIYGLELSATWKPVNWWMLQGWYSYCEDDYEYSGEGENIFAITYGAISPRHQFFLRTSLDLPHDTELDVMARYVSELSGLDIPDYATMDVRLGWHPRKNVEIALVGRNLLDTRHEESSSLIRRRRGTQRIPQGARGLLGDLVSPGPERPVPRSHACRTALAPLRILGSRNHVVIRIPGTPRRRLQTKSAH